MRVCLHRASPVRFPGPLTFRRARALLAPRSRRARAALSASPSARRENEWNISTAKRRSDRVIPGKIFHSIRQSLI
ncbi:hypothetical protein GCM10009771_01560 [Nesterenkonia flava]